jgi:glycosyltransferase involved in cell wall biosynthesis
MDNESLIFVARRPPFPLNNGGRIRTFHLLKGLSSAFRTTLITFEHHADSGEGSWLGEELRERLPGVRVGTVPGLGPLSRKAIFRSLWARRSWGHGRYPTAPLRDVVTAAVHEERARIVHFDDPAVALAGPLAGVVNVLSTHNVEYQITRSLGDASKGGRRLLAAVDWRKMAREERRVWRSMSVVLAVSELDAQVIQEQGVARVLVCPNGTEPVETLAPPRRDAGEPLRLMFLGSGDYRPNQFGLNWFLREALPMVREQVPTEFMVVGTPPHERVDGDGIEYVGTVPSVREWYERCHALVVPLFQGGGTRLKVIEAMAQGRPVVSTGIGAEGLPVRGGEHYLRAEDAEQFARTLVALARQLEEGAPELDRRLAAAQAAVQPLFWPQITSQLVDTYRSMLAK